MGVNAATVHILQNMDRQSNVKIVYFPKKNFASWRVSAPIGGKSASLVVQRRIAVYNINKKAPTFW